MEARDALCLSHSAAGQAKKQRCQPSRHEPAGRAHLLLETYLTPRNARPSNLSLAQTHNVLRRGLRSMQVLGTRRSPPELPPNPLTIAIYTRDGWGCLGHDINLVGFRYGDWRRLSPRGNPPRGCLHLVSLFYSERFMGRLFVRRDVCLRGGHD